MRQAYVALGIAWLIIIIAGVYAVNSRFISKNDTAPMNTTLTLTSTEFAEEGSIPSKFTCDGEQVNPPLSIRGVPAGAKSLVLIMDDPDVPKALKPDGVFDHWVLFNIPPETKEIGSGVTVGLPGRNGAGKPEYTGPCPPPAYEPSTHHYVFMLYALNSTLDLPAGASKDEVLRALQGHTLGEVKLTGVYKRTSS